MVIFIDLILNYYYINSFRIKYTYSTFVRKFRKLKERNPDIEKLGNIWMK